ncbi:MAG: NACHT domain-containing protein [Ktedonobacteraceae bacterium]
MKQVITKPRLSLTLIIIIMGLLSVLSSILGNLSLGMNRVPALAMLVISLQYPWIIFLGTTIVLIVFILLQYRKTKLTKRKGMQRRQLIETVKAFWIKGVLEPSLHGSLFIMPALSVELKRKRITKRTNQMIKSVTSAAQAYENAGGKLLILGSHGVGKTTLLLELARELLDRASLENNYPIPVVFNLSHWAKKRKTIDLWLVEELRDQYLIPQYLGKKWVYTYQLLPLLDNLDEVPENYRKTCIEYINLYIEASIDKKNVVVCCESDAYLAQNERLHLLGTVTLKPFAPQQIDDYLSGLREPVADLHVAIHKDLDLLQLAALPQNLTMLSHSNQEGLAFEPPLTSSLITQQQITTAYIESMIQSQTAKSYSFQQTIRYLVWLSKHNRTSFCLEDTESNWFLGRSSRLLYNLISLLLTCLIGGLIFALISGLSGLFDGGLPVALSDGLIGGLIGVIEGLFLFSLSRSVAFNLIESVTQLEPGIWRNLIFGLAGGLIVGLAAGIIGWLLYWQANGPMVGLVGGLILGLVSGLVGGMIGGFTVLLGTVLSGEMLQEYAPAKPFQGLWAYALNSVLIGFFGFLLTLLLGSLLLALTCALLVGLIGLISSGLSGLFIWSESTFSTVFVGLLIIIKSLGGEMAVFMILISGGNKYIRLLVLRLLLSSSGYIPWNYIRFLDYLVDCNLLRKVGKEYIFAHRPLLDYFASFDLQSIADDSSV